MLPFLTGLFLGKNKNQEEKKLIYWKEGFNFKTRIEHFYVHPWERAVIDRVGQEEAQEGW